MKSAYAFQLLLAFIAGGYITSLMNERWQRRREYNALMQQRMADLVRAYQRYVRLLRQQSDKRSEADLDFAHSAFMSEIRIMGFDRRFVDENQKLRQLAQRMANIRAGQVPDGQLKPKLNMKLM